MKEFCEITRFKDWHSTTCKNKSVEVIDEKSMCKMHAKQYKVRRGLDTGEILHTRFYATADEIYEINGIFTNKYFVVRKSKRFFGGGFFFDKNLEKDDERICEDLKTARLKVLEYLNGNIKALETTKNKLLEMMK